ncbi:MAG: branched-chain amino acid ABC transporter permease [Acidiferrobacterales bacterium]
MNGTAGQNKTCNPLFWLGVVVLLFLLTAPYLLPLIVEDFWVTVLAEIFIWGLFAASVNLLFGYTGLLSFGQAVYFGMGAYGVALGIDLLGFAFWPAFFFGVAVALVTAVVTGFFAVRLTWHYFAIITVVLSLIFYFIAVGWKDLTGGDDGLPFTLAPVFKWGELELSLSDLTFQYYFMLVIVSACFYLLYRVLQSPLGQALAAVRENDSRASLIGLSPYWIRYSSFVLAGGFAGVAGMLFALFGRYATAQYMFWTVSGEGVIWMIVGGARTLFGPALGAAFLIILREELSLYWEHYLLVVGAIVILTVTFAPQGIMGLLHKWIARMTAGAPMVEPEAKISKQPGESLE